MRVNVLTPGHLRLTCGRCTRAAGFESDSPQEAAKLAKAYGWVMDGECVTCPKCNPKLLFECPCGHKRNLKPGDVQKYCPACQTVAA